jgi:endonuclease/exonuclease/phosphatase family metal-dependent hydrolase
MIQGGRTMRILTWNLWWRHGPWQRRRPAIADTLAELAPDVCGLQEVWGGASENLAAELADRLGMHWCWASMPISPHRQAEHGTDISIGNAVLSRWPITARAELPLPVAAGEQPRVVVHARIEAPGGALPFFTTHLTHRPDASAERVAQVRALAGFVAEHRAGAVYPPVVTGDLNAEPDSDELRLLCGFNTAPAAPGLVLLDAWRYAEHGEPGHTWDHRNGHLGDEAVLDARIDYVLVGLPHGTRGRVRSVRVAADQPVGEVWPSDHFAVLAELAD